MFNVMPTPETDLIVTASLAIPLAELRFTYVRSSGPGGQNVNKVNSQAQLYWDLSATEALPADVFERFRIQQAGRISKEDIFRLDGQQYRDKEKNRLDCLDRLREILAQASEKPKVRKKTRISKGAKERRLKTKTNRSNTKLNRKTPNFDD